jgi:hypothetical protein
MGGGAKLLLPLFIFERKNKNAKELFNRKKNWLFNCCAIGYF